MWAKNEGNPVSMDVSVAINYPHIIGTFSVFAMVIHAMATISTNADSCFGWNSKIVLLLRINFTWWTPDGHFYLLSSFTAQSAQNGFQNMWNIMIGSNHIISGPKNDFMCENEDNLIFCT